MRNVPPKRWPAPPLPGSRSAPGRARPGGVRGTERSPAGSPLPRRHCPPARRPRRVRPGRLGHRRPAQAASAPRCCRVPSSRRPAARAPTSPPLGPYLAVLTLGLRGAVRDRSSFSAPAGPRRKPALGPPRRRLSSVSRAADPGLIPIGSHGRPSRPARLRAGGLFRRKRGPERPLLLLCHSGAAAAPGGGAGNDDTASADSQRSPRGGAAGSRPGRSTDVPVGLSWLTCTRGPVSAGGHPLGSDWSPLCTPAGRQPV
ncbi:hypothetical protein ACRRTK_013105 [Alexandromys fortis]